MKSLETPIDSNYYRRSTDFPLMTPAITFQQLVILLGLILGADLISQHNMLCPTLASVNNQALKNGTVNLAVRPDNSLMLSSNKQALALRLGEENVQKLHLDVNSISAWQLTAETPHIKDTQTQKEVDQVQIVFGVNGGEMHSLTETRNLISSGMLQQDVKLSVALRSMNPKETLDPTRTYQCDLNLNVIGVF